MTHSLVGTGFGQIRMSFDKLFRLRGSFLQYKREGTVLGVVCTRGALVFKLVNLIIKELLPRLWIIFRLGRTP